MVDKIVKLINSGDKENIILAIHLLAQYTWKEILDIFEENFTKVDSYDRETRYYYDRCIMLTYFHIHDRVIYMGATHVILDVEMNFPIDSSRNIIKVT